MSFANLFGKSRENYTRAAPLLLSTCIFGGCGAATLGAPLKEVCALYVMLQRCDGRIRGMRAGSLRSREVGIGILAGPEGGQGPNPSSKVSETLRESGPWVSLGGRPSATRWVESGAVLFEETATP